MSLPYKLLRPGYLVGLKTALKGDNVTYDKVVIEDERVDEYGQLVSKWETDKTIADAAEQERAVKTRSKARNLVTAVCAKSDFGYLCPDDRLNDLEGAIDEASRLCDEFNLTASRTEIIFSTLKGRIAADDGKAIDAIKGELAELLGAMETGVRGLNVEAIREAAIKAKELGKMLQPGAQKEVMEYVNKVRKLATEINKAGDQAATVVNDQVLAGLANARTSFLDFDGGAEVKDTVVEGRVLDLDPDIAQASAAEVAETPVDTYDDDFLTVAPVEQVRELDLEDMLS
jgi:hypothetical protein